MEEKDIFGTIILRTTHMHIFGSLLQEVFLDIEAFFTTLRKGDDSMLLLIRFDADADIIDIPQFVIAIAESYQTQFLEWLCNKDNHHAYWHYINGEKWGLCYRSDAFVEWLNAFHLATSSEKAKTMETYVNEWDVNLPVLYF